MKKPKTMSQTEAARAAGLKQPQLSRWETSGDLPKPRGGAYTNADVDKIKAFAAERRANANATSGRVDETGIVAEDGDTAIRQLRLNPEKAARVRYLIERTASVKLDRELKAGGWLKREDVEAANVRKVYAIRSKLQELPMRADLLVGKTAIEIEDALTAWAKEICEHFANGGR